VYALQSPGRSNFFSVVSVGIMVAGASLLLGGILGFLFGIPRTLQNEIANKTAPAKDVSGDSDVNYRVNTNLEQISDWLTKILVGVGLTQITSLPTQLTSISATVADGLGGNPGSSVLAFALLLYFFVAGFLFGYLWTRLYLATAFRQADLMAIGSLAERVKETDLKLDKIQDQSESNDEALHLISKQLSQSQDEPEISQERLDKAILAATPPIRARVYNETYAVRRGTWFDNKALMERTIPIFRALIKADTKEQYHKNHGQLGFALKDQRQPDLKAALQELSKAIEIRGSWQEYGWRFYEFNRAYCRIKLDAYYERTALSEASVRDAIIADLRAAATHDAIKKIILDDEVIRQWMQLNTIEDSML